MSVCPINFWVSIITASIVLACASKNVDDMQYGDIVLYEINGEGHTGVYVGEHKVLTILQQFQRSMIVRLRQNNLFFKSGYRKKVTA